MQRWSDKYELLDGVRGLAAVGVVLHHLGVANIGHYCVMMFFVISGYCIAASTESALRRGVSIATFIANRGRRIFPAYLFAIIFFAVTRIARTHMEGKLWSPSWLDWFQNVTLTQWLSLLLHPAAEAAQNPTLFVAAFWSLNYELQFYLVMAAALLLARRYKFSIVKFVLLLFVAGLAWNIAWPAGWVTGFFLEYWVHFALGAFVYYVLCKMPQFKYRSMLWFACMALLFISLVHLLPWHGATAMATWRVYLEFSVSALVAIVFMVVRPLSESVCRSVWWRPIAAIGAISYSLYLIHQFNLRIVAAVAAQLLPGDAPHAGFVVTQLALHLGMATCFWYVCERPFTRKLTNHSSVASDASIVVR